MEHDAATACDALAPRDGERDRTGLTSEPADAGQFVGH